MKHKSKIEMSNKDYLSYVKLLKMEKSNKNQRHQWINIEVKQKEVCVPLLQRY